MRTVIGIDLSREGLAAGDWVARWLLPESEIALAYSVQVPQGPRFTTVHDEGHDEIVAFARQEAARALQPLVQEYGLHRTTVLVGEGPPAETLLALAREWDGEAVAVGPSGHSPTPFRSLGSTAARLIRESEFPVVIVRDAKGRAPKRLLVALDDGAPEGAVLEPALALAEVHGAQVLGAYVYETLLPGLPEAGKPADDDALTPALREAAEEWLSGVMDDAGLPPGNTETRVRAGHAGEEICALALDDDVDLIVMGTHGRPLAGPTIGSVARYVAGHAPCPVLVVPRGRSAMG
ncbi:MAG: universal stress protein [Gemmatimonadota bacterium]|nr:universal stress protein [Gemmatimonadota bacterium]